MRSCAFTVPTFLSPSAFPVGRRGGYAGNLLLSWQQFPQRIRADLRNITNTHAQARARPVALATETCARAGNEVIVTLSVATATSMRGRCAKGRRSRPDARRGRVRRARCASSLVVPAERAEDGGRVERGCRRRRDSAPEPRASAARRLHTPPEREPSRRRGRRSPAPRACRLL